MARRGRNTTAAGRSAPPARAGTAGPGARVRPAELAVRRLERQALAAVDVARRAAETAASLGAAGEGDRAEVERAAVEAQRLEQEAGRRVDEAVRARLDLDVPVGPSTGADAGDEAPGEGGDGPGRGELEVVTWNRPDWSWDRLVAAALDEPPPDDRTAGTATTGGPSSPARAEGRP